MSVENGKVCCNCRHCIREWHGSDCRCRCEISGDYLGYVRVMEGWCRHWSEERADRCYECKGYGDDYYYDEETGEDVSACDGCPWNEDWEGE